MQESSANVKCQYFAAFVVNMLSAGYGVTAGWASPSLILLTSDETPLQSGQITMDEASAVAALTSLGGLIGNIFFGWITSKFGRKNPLVFMTIPTIISWLLILYGQNVFHLYASRILSGFVGGGIFVIVPAFLSEIAVDRVRGVLGSMLTLTCNVGILLAFIFGKYLDYFATPKIVIALTVACAILLFFLHESPSVLIKANKTLEAEKSIKFYQNLNVNNDKDFKHLQSEMNRLQNTIANVNEDKTSDNSFKWSDLTVAPGKNAMMIGIVLVLLNQFCGCVAMLNYTAKIFKDAGSNMDPNMSAIVVGIIQLIGSYVTTNLVDRAGRKFLYVVSSIGIALGLITLGTYMMLKTSGYNVEIFNWVPITSFSFVIFIGSWGVLTLPFLVISEIMPEKLKNFGPSFCMIILWSSQFLVVKYLPLLTDTLGFHYTLFIFAGVCLFGAMFIIASMPETKGRSYDEIMKMLR
ncbi:facilitated trehalose transporter Tret1-like [Contarinia nasturtii]|uniref:facilitated trehalose transporter Tret1-like n=1 Tax=Contarinia nasturtii TaxID=265458 RepID=UPI0012D44C09|nr:facilitated trehalose transporter Tret1-like [Contarinia nasturtii]